MAADELLTQFKNSANGSQRFMFDCGVVLFHFTPQAGFHGYFTGTGASATAAALLQQRLW